MKKLAIVGSGPATRLLAPFDDLSFDIWVFNEAASKCESISKGIADGTYARVTGDDPRLDALSYDEWVADVTWCKRWDAVFQMHEPDIYRGHNTKDDKHWEWLQQKHGKPIYMQEEDRLVPDSVRYPLDDAIALSGHKYLTGTPAQAIALGLLKGYEQIELWAIELSATEYLYQAECIRFWAGFAKGRLGAENFRMHGADHLFEAPLYGYDGNFSFGKEFFSERREVLDRQWIQQENLLKRATDKLKDAINEMRFDKVPALSQEWQMLAVQTGEISGAMSEAERYLGFGDRIADRGGFEHAAAEGQRDLEKQRSIAQKLEGQFELLANAWSAAKTNAATQNLLTILGLLGEASYATGAQLGKYRENLSYMLKYDQTAQANGVFVPKKSMQEMMAELPVA